MILGAQLIALGIVAELQIRAMISSGAKTYTIASRWGFDGDAASPAAPGAATGPPGRGVAP
jgi:hypothetical protein